MDERIMHIYQHQIFSIIHCNPPTTFFQQFFPSPQTQLIHLLILGSGLAQTALGWREAEDSPATTPRGNPKDTCSLQEVWEENNKGELQAEAIICQGKG